MIEYFLYSVTCIVLTIFLYQIANLNKDYFKKRGVKYAKPIPFFGNIFKSITGLASLPEVFDTIYKQFPNERVVGLFELRRPVYLVRDPDIMVQIKIKEFDHYVNHRITVDENINPLLGRAMLVMKDQKWRDMRSKLSPAFTGSKMRQMFSLIVDKSNETVEYLKENSDCKEMDFKDFFRRITNDVIGTCAFGVDIHSNKNRDNEFFKMGLEVADFGGIQGLKFFGFSAIPEVMKFFRIKFFSTTVVKFFNNLVHGTIKYREENSVIRHDMIHLLNLARKGKLKHEINEEKNAAGFATATESDVGKMNTTEKFNDEDLTAQAVIFFIAGFDSVALLLCFMSHELALNQDVQKRLLEEIDEMQKELNGKPITYDLIHKMKYLDMCICESLRKWPLGAAIDRVCNKTSVIEQTDGKLIQINKGDGIWFPIYSIHRDPEYYPNPDKYDPERFSDLNKSSIKASTYIPFGMGPRNCIGSRFALMETKAIFYHILSHFEIHVSQKTHIPLELKKNSFIVQAENGFWLQFKGRK